MVHTSFGSGEQSGSIEPNFLMEAFRKIRCYRTAVFRFGKRNRSIAPNFPKGNHLENLVLINRQDWAGGRGQGAGGRGRGQKAGNPPEHLVLSNRPSLSLLLESAGSIAPNFLKGSPSENLVLSNRPLFVVSVCYG